MDSGEVEETAGASEGGLELSLSHSTEVCIAKATLVLQTVSLRAIEANVCRPDQSVRKYRWMEKTQTQQSNGQSVTTHGVVSRRTCVPFEEIKEKYQVGR